jgi:hypothetical protein
LVLSSKIFENRFYFLAWGAGVAIKINHHSFIFLNQIYKLVLIQNFDHHDFIRVILNLVSVLNEHLTALGTLVELILEVVYERSESLAQLGVEHFIGQAEDVLGDTGANEEIGTGVREVIAVIFEQVISVDSELRTAIRLSYLISYRNYSNSS